MFHRNAQNARFLFQCVSFSNPLPLFLRASEELAWLSVVCSERDGRVCLRHLKGSQIHHLDRLQTYSWKMNYQTCVSLSTGKDAEQKLHIYHFINHFLPQFLLNLTYIQTSLKGDEKLYIHHEDSTIIDQFYTFNLKYPADRMTCQLETFACMIGKHKLKIFPILRKISIPHYLIPIFIFVFS